MLEKGYSNEIESGITWSKLLMILPGYMYHVIPFFFLYSGFIGKCTHKADAGPSLVYVIIMDS